MESVLRLSGWGGMRSRNLTAPSLLPPLSRCSDGSRQPAAQPPPASQHARPFGSRRLAGRVGHPAGLPHRAWSGERQC